jgi:hypothetical protein
LDSDQNTPGRIDLLGTGNDASLEETLRFQRLEYQDASLARA